MEGSGSNLRHYLCSWKDLRKTTKTPVMIISVLAEIELDTSQSQVKSITA
jgi:hypothetical protein